jgi:hypothetical protein
MSSSVASAKAHLAVEVKKRKKSGEAPEGPSVQDARRVLAEEKIKQYVAAVVATAPPLGPEQLSRLAALFRGTGA